MEIFSRCTALILIVILFPLFILLGTFSLIFQGSPIFFIQERIGLNFKPFNIIKFRTMVINRDKSMVTMSGDRRITKWGKFLRYFKIDELPQLWNIIKGDMRFIGPRPEVKKFINKKSFHFLKFVNPGLTDLSSILLRNEEEILKMLGGVDNYPELLNIKAELGNLYAKNKGFKLDLVLTLSTLIVFLMPSFVQKNINRLFVRSYSIQLFNKIEALILL